MNSPLFKRVNLCVSDLDRSLVIYRDILGFSVDYQKVSDENSYSYPVFAFPEKVNLRFATLNTPTQERALALTEVKGIKLPLMPEPRMAAAVINCSEFDEVLGEVTLQGLTVINPQVLPDKNGLPKGREAAFLDPDGHLIVIYVLDD